MKSESNSCWTLRTVNIGAKRSRSCSAVKAPVLKLCRSKFSARRNSFRFGLRLLPPPLFAAFIITSRTTLRHRSTVFAVVVIVWPSPERAVITVFWFSLTGNPRAMVVVGFSQVLFVDGLASCRIISIYFINDIIPAAKSELGYTSGCWY